MTDRETHPLVEVFVDHVEAVWCRGGMLAATRRRLAAELERDLGEAVALGAPASEVVDHDPEAFARELAAAHDVPLEALPVTSVSSGDLAGPALLGLMAALPVAWVFFLYGAPEAVQVSPYFVVWAYVGGGLVLLAGVAAATWWKVRAVPAAPRLVATTALLVALGGAISLAPIAGIGALNDYGSSPMVVLLDVAVAGLCCSGAVWLRRPLGNLLRS